MRCRERGQIIDSKCDKCQKHITLICQHDKLPLVRLLLLLLFHVDISQKPTIITVSLAGIDHFFSVITQP